MRIGVCVKIVDGEINPFDECALEEALRIPDAEVFVLSMCPLTAAEKLRFLTRLGVKEVYLLSDKVYAGSDTLFNDFNLTAIEIGVLTSVPEVNILNFKAYFGGFQYVSSHA